MAEKKATKTTAKKTEAKKAPTEKVAVEKAPAKKAAVKKAPAKKAAKSKYTAEQVYTLVETAAYFAAVNDGFQKDPSSYWLQAEKEVNG